MAEYSFEEERRARLKQRERTESMRNIDACYNEELDLWNTIKLTGLRRKRLEKLERECRFSEIFEKMDNYV